MLIRILPFVLLPLQFVKLQEESEGFHSDVNGKNEIDTSTDYSLFWNSLDFDHIYDSFVNSNPSYPDRENRRNEFIPFNSLTFQEGGAANTKFKSKIRDKGKDSSGNKFEWWKKQKLKDKKKKKNKKKPQFSPSRSTTRATTTTRTTTTSTTTERYVTTWFPNSSFKASTTWHPTSSEKSTSGYFSRPLDHQKPIPIRNSWWTGGGGDKKGRNLILIASKTELVCMRD